MRNVILTGIPRAGTTLAAALIDSLPDTVCLNEPLWQTAKVGGAAPDFARWLVGDFVEVRQKLLKGEPVSDRRAADGKAVTNYYRAKDGKMENTFEQVLFARDGLTPGFTLAMKHNGPYLAVLKPLIDLGHFTIIAIVRNPIEVLASWRSLDLPVSRGEMPNAGPYWPKLADVMSADIELLEKQVKMLDLMFKRIHHLRDHMQVLTYEAMVNDPSLLTALLGAKEANTSLVKKSPKAIGDKERSQLAAALQKHGAFYREFYPAL